MGDRLDQIKPVKTNKPSEEQADMRERDRERECVMEKEGMDKDKERQITEIVIEAVVYSLFRYTCSTNLSPRTNANT